MAKVTISQIKKNPAEFLYLFAIDSFLDKIDSKSAAIIRGKRTRQAKILKVACVEEGKQYATVVKELNDILISDFGHSGAECLKILADGGEIAGKNWSKGIYGIGATTYEGFSGTDGRSTIFDYWAPDTLSRWYKDGVLSDKHLTREEIDLKSFYNRLFNICTPEQAISKGLFFDLMYVNPASANFDPHKEYAFIRKYQDTLLLIVANFSDTMQRSQITIPEHAFNYLDIRTKGRTTAIELFTGQEYEIDLQADTAINVQIPENAATILTLLFI